MRVSRRVGGIGFSDKASLVESGEDDHDRRDYTKDGKDILLGVVGEVMKERRRRERERLII